MAADIQTNPFPLMLLSAESIPETLSVSWELDTFRHPARKLLFWDTFEWSLWFSGQILYSNGKSFHLCHRDIIWPPAALCSEEIKGHRSFWQDFSTQEMRGKLKELIGLRAIRPVADSMLAESLHELRNELGKIVCRVSCQSIANARQSAGEPLNLCRIVPLKGYEHEAVQAFNRLLANGAEPCSSPIFAKVFEQSGATPAEYTLRPEFGITQDMPAREAASRIVNSMLELIHRNIPGLLNDIDTEFLHDYRICLRKTRSLLGLLKDVYPEAETKSIREALGEMARSTNSLRDLDVYMLSRDEYSSMLPSELRSATDEMFLDFAKERKTQLKKVVSRIKSGKYKTFFEDMANFFSGQSGHAESRNAEVPVKNLAYAHIYRRFRKVRRLSAAITVDSPDEMLHQVRIECKKLRYLMEFFSEIIPQNEVDSAQKQLRRLQGRLGEFNDASVQQAALLAYLKKKQPETGLSMAIGGLVTALYQRQQQARSSIFQSLEEFGGLPAASLFKRIFKLKVEVPAP